MFIIWGKKKTTRQLGYVAEFCPVCHEITPCRLVRIGLTGHLWYISFLKGELLGYFAQCSICGYEQEVDGSLYADRVRSARVPLSELIQRTFPAIEQARAEQLQEAAVIRAGGRVSREERQLAILKGMSLFIDKLDHIPSPLTVTKPAGWCMVLTILLMVSVNRVEEKLDLFEKYPSLDEGQTYKWIFLTGMGLALVLMIGARLLFIRRGVLPAMARCLRPLHPSREELDLSLARLRKAQVKVGSAISANSLLREIEKSPA